MPFGLTDQQLDRFCFFYRENLPWLGKLLGAVADPWAEALVLWLQFEKGLTELGDTYAKMEALKKRDS